MVRVKTVTWAKDLIQLPRATKSVELLTECRKPEKAKPTDINKMIEKPEEAKSTDTNEIIEKPEEANSADTNEMIKNPEEAKSVDTGEVIEKPEEAKTADTNKMIENPEEAKSVGTGEMIEKPEEIESAGTSKMNGKRKAEEPKKKPKKRRAKRWYPKRKPKKGNSAEEQTGKQKRGALKSRKKQAEEEEDDRPKYVPLDRKLLNDYRYRFVYDLFKAVREVKMVRQDEDLPDPYTYPMSFEQSHKRIVQKYVRNQLENFNLIIHDYVFEDFDTEAYNTCRELFEDFYKPDEYTEIGFMYFLSAIGYLAYHFGNNGENGEAWNLAFNYTFNLVNQVLENSKYQYDFTESSW